MRNMNPYILSSLTPPLWLPTNIGGCKIWYRSDFGVTTDSEGFISNVADKTGNGYNISQATASLQPVLNSDGFNLLSKPAIMFPAAHIRLASSAFTLNQPCTFWGIAYFTNENYGYLFDGATGDTRSIMHQTTDVYWMHAGSLLSTDVGDPVLNAWRYFIATFNGANSKLYLDGVLKASGNSGAANPNGIVVGCYKDGGDYGFAGGVVELGGHEGVISDPDQVLLNAYLTGRMTLGSPSSDISNPVLSLRASLGVTKDGSDRVSNWTDQSSYGNNAYQTIETRRPIWHSNGMEFDGTQQCFVINNSTSLNPTHLTVGGWVYIHTVPASNGDVILKTYSAAPAYQYDLSIRNVGDQAYARVYTDGLAGLSTAAPLSLNTWYHLAFTYDGYKIKLYVNGILNNSITSVGVIHKHTDPMALGADYPADVTHFDGLLDEVAIYDRALSAEAILVLKNVNVH